MNSNGRTNNGANGHETGDVRTLDGTAVNIALFAWEWARLLAGTGWVAADRTVVVEELRTWTIRLIEAIRQEPFDASAGTELGHALVSMGFSGPEALGRTSSLIIRRFLGHGEEALQLKVAEVVSSISAGFVRAVRDKTLEEQDAIRSSALLALERVRADQREAELLDPVTGLLNRKGFTAALTDLLASSPPGVLGVCLLTLGGFEPLYRGFGPAVGDELLKTVAERLSARFGGRDELIGRVGREEFIVAAIGVKSLGHDGQPSVAERVSAAQDAVRAPITLGERAMVLSPSVGVVSRPTGSADPETVLRDVGLAGSWARDRGTGSIALFEVERATKQVAGLTLAAELPRAIESGRLLAYYQPIVGLRSGRVELVEALARWEHEKHGLLEPDAFIPLAQRAGLIDELGRSVLERACRQALAWGEKRGEKRGPVVSVNLDPQQITEQATVGHVVATLDQLGLPPHRLQLEITEDAALGDPQAQAVIRDLAHVGVALALDDFGTGRAHLARLAELPGLGIRTLKLAGEFLAAERPLPSPSHEVPGRLTSRLFGSGRHPQPATPGSGRRDVLASTIALAHRLGMQVTVEGVQTAQDETLVASLGADHAQGSYYSVPMAPADASDFLRRS